MKNLAITAALCALPLAAQTLETLEPPKCFTFRIDSPARDLVVPEDNKIIGCYLRVNEKQEMAFVKDETGADLLTTALTERGNGSIKLKHFSMSRGQVVMAQQKNYEINPLPIPATLKEAMESAQNEGESHSLTDSKTLEDVKKALRLYRNPVHEKIIIDAPSAAQIVRDEEFYLPEEKQPTDGYWWPHIGLPLARDEYSPLAKYDAYVKSVSGNNPNTVGWEKRYHNSSVDWAGHCNGWASASILYGYDDVDLRDEANNTTIFSSDIQGMRSVLSYCTRNAFYGRRYYGPRSDINDIYPHNFHRLLTYYIKNLGKPVVYDYRVDAPVDNHIISGYKFTFEQTSESGKWLVKAQLRSHGYSYDNYVHERRIAPTYTRTYWYYLWENRYGRFYKGEWVNPQDHPDFVWVPLRESRCGGENPRFSQYWFDHMLENLEEI